MTNLTTENTAKEILAALNSARIEKGLAPLKTAASKREMLAQINFDLPKVTDTDDPEDPSYRHVITFPGTETKEKPAQIESSVLSQVLNPLKDCGGLFTPTEVELTLPNGEIVPDKKAIIDKDSDEYVSTVGSNYQLISNREVFTQFANVLQSSSLDTTDMRVRSTITKSRSYVQFTFPKHSVEVREGDITELQIVARNSYDGSLRFSLEIGGFRILCSNGMGIGSYTNVFSNKHSSGYDPEKMAEYLETAVEVFETAGDEWKHMTEIKVNDDQALEVLKIMTEKPGNATYSEVMEGKSGVLKDALIEWERYVKELGLNKFALYNTVTHLSSHATTKAGCVVGLRVYKDKIRDKALNSPAFRTIQAA